MRSRQALLAALAVLATAISAAGCGGSSAAPAAWTWTPVASPTPLPLNSVVAIDPTHGWAVGIDSTLVFYDGTSWTLHPQSGVIVPGGRLWGVCASGAASVWAVGSDGLVLYFDGNAWSVLAYEPGSNHDLWSCSSPNPGHAVASSYAGAIAVLTSSTRTWEFHPAVADLTLRGIWAASFERFWAAGDAIVLGALVTGGPDAWTARLTPEAMEAVDGSDVGNIWMVGLEGAAYRFDGSAWTARPTGTTALLRGVEVLDATHVWAVGDPDGPDTATGPSTLLFFDGTSWSRQSPGTTGVLFGVSTLDGAKVWVVGDHGKIILGTRG